MNVDKLIDEVIEREGGRMTLAALDGYVKKRGAAGGEVLRRALDSLQGARYIELAEKSPSQEAFAYGWLANRVG